MLCCQFLGLLRTETFSLQDAVKMAESIKKIIFVSFKGINFTLDFHYQSSHFYVLKTYKGEVFCVSFCSAADFSVDHGPKHLPGVGQHSYGGFIKDEYCS